MDKMKKVFNNERGLTLVELAVVLIIFGALLVYLVPKFGDMIDKSKVAGVKSDMKVYTQASETVLRDTNGESVTGVMLNENLDVSYHFNGSNVSSRKDGWKNSYGVRLAQATDVSATATANGNAVIVVTSTGKSSSSTGDDIISYTYLYGGNVSSCLLVGGKEVISSSSVTLVGACGTNAVL